MTYHHKKHFGQHFLHDKVLIDQLIAYIQPQKNDLMLEIGPGSGALTMPLLSHLEKLYAVEVDRDCVSLLSKQWDASRLEIFQQDVLTFSLEQIKQDRLIRVVGNLPYNISTPLLFHLYQQNHHVHDYHVMVQLEVAQRICATEKDKAYGRLSVMSQYYCDPTWLCDIAPISFIPPPQVDSTFIRLEPKRDRDQSIEKTLAQVVASAFNQRRKTLSNSLKTLLTPDDFLSLGLDKKVRAENLSPQSYGDIARYIMKRDG
jgi:16S rRNA (adenine1518-N6/adenine1519-N6)-dimethyltransferase